MQPSAFISKNGGFTVYVRTHYAYDKQSAVGKDRTHAWPNYLVSISVMTVKQKNEAKRHFLVIIKCLNLNDETCI